MAILGTSGAWIVQRHGPTASIRQSRPAAGASIDERLLSTALLSGEECSRLVRGEKSETIWRLIAGRDAAFWQSNPNAGLFLRQAGYELGTKESPAVLLVELRSRLERHSLSEGTMRSLLGSAFCGMLEARPLAQSDFIVLLKNREKTEALSLLELWLDFQKPVSLRADVATAEKIAGAVFPELDKALKDGLMAMVVRIWAHRAPSVADALLFAYDIQEIELQKLLLEEGAHSLAVANPKDFLMALIRFGPEALEPAATAASNAGLSVPDAFKVAAAMPEKDRGTFLCAYLGSLCLKDPREMLKVATAYSASQLPVEAAAIVAQGMARTGDYGGLQTWMSGLDAQARAKLWDASMHTSWQGPGLSVAEARTYLANRPNEVPGTDALRDVLTALPIEEATRELARAQGLNPELRNQIEEAITNRAFVTLRKENPGRIPEFLATLPEVRRQKLLQNGAGFYNSEVDAATLESWAAESADPGARAALENRRLSNEMRSGNLATAEALALPYVQNGAPAYNDSIDRLVGRLAETDSSRAEAFIARLPAGELRDKSTATFVRKWAELDPIAASDWLAQSPPTPGRDLAVRELVACTRDDPERALANAAGIQYPKLRLDAARTVLRVWRDSDPNQAASFLQNAGFSTVEIPILRGMLGLDAGGQR